jgi:ABC-2 type transport system permease protein
MKFNYYAFRAMYLHEMDRFRRTLMQSLFSPVLSTSLYFIVFGSVIGGYVEKIDGISYGSYIVPGLLMLTLLTQSISNTSFGIFFPKFNGTIYEILAAPISTFEIVLAFVGAGATKTLIVGVVIFNCYLFCRSSSDVSIINDIFISTSCFYIRSIWFFNWIDEF